MIRLEKVPASAQEAFAALETMAAKKGMTVKFLMKTIGRPNQAASVYRWKLGRQTRYDFTLFLEIMTEAEGLKNARKLESGKRLWGSPDKEKASR